LKHRTRRKEKPYLDNRKKSKSAKFHGREVDLALQSPNENKLSDR
jgi:hypothetical protein